MERKRTRKDKIYIAVKKEAVKAVTSFPATV